MAGIIKLPTESSTYRGDSGPRVVDFSQFATMGPWDALIHLANFFAPAVGVGLIAALLAKLLWHGQLKGVSVMRMAGWAALAGSAVLVAGLVVFGRDGKMTTYGAMVVASALALLWAGWGRK
jgi:amino acid permease